MFLISFTSYTLACSAELIFRCTMDMTVCNFPDSNYPRAPRIRQSEVGKNWARACFLSAETPEIMDSLIRYTRVTESILEAVFR